MGLSGGGGSSLTIGGVLTKTGTLNVGNSDLLGADTVTATGVVNVTSGGTTGILAPGTINITGNFYAPI